MKARVEGFGHGREALHGIIEETVALKIRSLMIELPVVRSKEHIPAQRQLCRKWYCRRVGRRSSPSSRCVLL